MDENMMIDRGQGLVDLIAGVTPTFVDWTVDPTDAADITDGDISSFCTTGNKVMGAGWQRAHIEWDLGAFYNVLCSGVGTAAVTAGTEYLFVDLWNGAAWVAHSSHVLSGAAVAAFSTVSGMASQVRLSITGDAAATITPNIREFSVWRLK